MRKRARFPRGWERMRIERRFTEAGQSPYDAVPFRESASEIRNPDGSVVFRLDDIEVPAHWSQVAADILAQKYFRKAGVPARAEAGRGERRSLLAVALGRRRGGAGRAARGRALRRRDRRPAGVRPPGRHLDLLGLEGRLFRQPRTTRAPSTTSSATCSPRRWWRPTRRNGSTPACTGPMASTARARAITTSTTPPAS